MARSRTSCLLRKAAYYPSVVWGLRIPASAHVAHAPFDARGRRPEHALGFLLHKEGAELEGHRVVTAGEHDACTAGLRRGFVLADHLVHPDRLAAEVEIVGARGNAGRQQLVAVPLIWADRRNDRLGVVDH